MFSVGQKVKYGNWIVRIEEIYRKSNTVNIGFMGVDGIIFKHEIVDIKSLETLQNNQNNS